MPVTFTFNRTIAILASAAIVLWLLSWLQSVLIPIALAIMFTFLLSPLVGLIQQKWLPRAPAVMLVVAFALALVGALGWLVAHQVTGLVDTFPQYEQNLTAKLSTLSTGEGFVDKLQGAVKRISRQLDKTRRPAVTVESEPVQNPLTVTVVTDEGPFQLARIWSVLGPIMEPFATVGLTVVLVIFMLLRREDLRDRIISLVGHGRLTVTTRALDEAGERISRYLVRQLLLNGGYGVMVAVGLFLLDVPYAPLWGFFAAVLRYIPYLGAWLAALLPVGLTLLESTTWTPSLLVIGWFLILESITNMVLEPMLYGRGIGVSETATLVMVAFWTWLWGPVGLILATPLTVCLVVSGKYVPYLKSFDILLGDQPALEAHVGYYQRLLARDQDEAAEIAEDYLEEHSLTETFDCLLIPALTYAQRDAKLDDLSYEDQRFVVQATREIAEQLITLRQRAAKADNATGNESIEPKVSRLLILGCPAREDADEVALLMFKESLDPGLYDVVLSTSALLASEVIGLVREARPALLCLAVTPPGGIAQARLLCLRLQANFPEMKVLIGRWGASGDVEKTREQFLAAGAFQFATTIAASCDQVAALQPLLLGQAAESQASMTLLEAG